MVETIPKEKKTGYEKLYDQIKIIADKARHDILDTLEHNSLGASNIDNEYGAHTLLKLSYLNYYLGIFTRIAISHKKKGGFSKVVFIDAFGGSGLVGIKNTKYTVLGSSLLAALNGGFDKIISFEVDKERANILSKRLNLILPEKCQVINGDVNEEIGRIVDNEITSKTIVLFFVDPEGMEPQFSKLRKLIDKTQYVDILMNYTWGVYRLQGRIEKNFSMPDINRMQSFLDGYKLGGTPDEALLEMFETKFGKPFGDNVPIKSKGEKTEYSMVLRIRRTQGGTKFIDPMKEFGKIIGSYSGEDCNNILRTIKGDQQSIL